MTLKLADDCFRPGQPRLRHAEAIARLSAAATPTVNIEEIAIADAGGRILAVPVVAPASVPNYDNSAVDGYAYRAGATPPADGVLDLPVVGRAAAGHPLAAAADPGSAVRILTGAVMPAGLDTVAMQEDVGIPAGDPPRVRIPVGQKRGANVRRAGEDLQAGTVLIEPGHLLRPQDIAGLASVGLARVSCRRRLRVAVVSTGDEVRRPGSGTLGHGEVWDANQPMLMALLALSGAYAVDLGVWPDDRAIVRDRLAAAARVHDVILTSGGASRGEEDHIASSLEAIGRRHFWQIDIKPGRPMMLGQVGDTVAIGLPGNPVAVLVCYLLYVHPLLRRLAGAPWIEPRRYTLPAAFDFTGRKRGRREFWRGILVDTPAGPAIDKFARDGSGLITGLRSADGLIDIPEDTGDIARGTPVSFLPFTEFGFPPRTA